jgi:hypothetical protein
MSISSRWKGASISGSKNTKDIPDFNILALAMNRASDLNMRLKRTSTLS